MRIGPSSRGFSVISGILLLVNLVIMLAEERKVEFGLLRAVGFKRAALLRSFSLEGSLYALSAAVLGAIVGVGVGALVIEGTQKIFAEPNSTFRIDLFVHARTLLLAAGLGYAISIVTIWLASARVSRLNIISSIRDLPAPRRSGRHLGRISLAGLGVVAGSIATVVGVRAGSQIPLMAGIPVASFSAIGVVTQMNFHSQRPVRVASVVGPIAAIAWTLGVFTLFSTQMEHAGIAVFVVMGLLLVAAGGVLGGIFGAFIAVPIAATVMAAFGQLGEMLPAVQKAGAGEAGEAVVVQAGQRPEDPRPVARGALAGRVGAVDEGDLPVTGSEAFGDRCAGHAGADHQRRALGRRSRRGAPGGRAAGQHLPLAAEAGAAFEGKAGRLQATPDVPCHRPGGEARAGRGKARKLGEDGR